MTDDEFRHYTSWLLVVCAILPILLLIAVIVFASNP